MKAPVAIGTRSVFTASIDDVKGSQIQSEAALLDALLNGPVVVDLCIGGNKQFLFYQGGVLDQNSVDNSPNSPSCVDNDHSVLLTGYGTDDDSGADYWLIQNSWGKMWGEKGFARIQRSDSSNTRSKGLYNIASHAVYPVGGRMASSPSRVSPTGIVMMFMCCTLIVVAYVRYHSHARNSDSTAISTATYTNIDQTCHEEDVQIELQRVTPQFALSLDPRSTSSYQSDTRV